MPKILFTHSYFLRFDPKQFAQMQPYPPLGTIYAAAKMRSEGHLVSLFDPMFAQNADEIFPVLKKENPDYLVIYDDGFNYLTKMCLTNMREAAFEMTAIAKNQGCKVIVNSSDSTDHFEKYLDHGADYIITGEGEISLTELINVFENGNGSIENVEGIIFRKNNQTVINKKRKVLEDLDSLPAPAWDLVNVDDYKTRWLKSSGYFSLNLSTTRGCPFKCNWCAKPIYGNRYNVHSPARVVSDIKMMQQHFGVNHFWMTDDIFGLKPQWTNEFSKLAQQENLKFSYKIQSRVDLLLQEENIASLAASGCDTVWVGAESGSQKILDEMDKGTTIQQIHEATHMLKSHGIKVAFFLQFGYPGEDIDDITKTIDMVLELMPEDIGVSVSYPLPGTKFYERVKNELDTKANWTHSDELALMFKNKFPSEFYKELQRYLHTRFRSRQGMMALKDALKNPATLSAKNILKLSKAPYHYFGSLLHASKMKQIANEV
jgi:anaerobic magnesium-protoporphyrin IX monomethyl ester cyclase